MELFELLQRVAQVAQVAHTAQQSHALPAVHEVLVPWMQRLGAAAVQRWLPVFALRAQCGQVVGHRTCGQRAVVECVVCHAVTCLDHAMVGSDGSAICHRCVVAAAAQQPLPAVKRSSKRAARDEDEEELPDDVAQAYRDLGVAPTASDAQVEKAFTAKCKTLRGRAASAQRSMLTRSLETIGRHRNQAA